MQVMSYRENGDTSNIERVFLFKDSGATAGTEGDPITGLTNASTGLNISTIANNEATANTDTSAATSSIETVTTLGTFATPTAGFVRFREVDATNMPGLYELQWENARYAVSSAIWLDVTISGVADLAPFHGRIYLKAIPANVTEVNGAAQTATLDTIKAETVLIVADTNELQGDWVNAGRLDAILDTIAADVVNVDGYNLATQIGTAGAGLTNIGTIATCTTVTNGVTLAAGAITDASLAGAMEIVFETDFATNYNQTDNAWVTNGTSFIGTGWNVAKTGYSLTTADWNVGKTGYTLTATTGLGNQTANIAGSITSVTNEVTADAVKFGGATVTATTAVTIPASSTLATTTGAVGSVTGAVGSVTGHTNQTGDNFAIVNGTAGLVAIDTVVDAIKVVTDALPDAGALTTLQADTDDIQTRLPAALIGGRMDSDVEAINAVTAAAVNLSASALSIVPAICEGTPSTTVIQTDLAEATDDHYIGRIAIFTSGAAAYQASDITDYTGATGTITVTALTTAPAVSDTLVIV